MITNLFAYLWTRISVAREEGQAMVEYALILALVSIAAITVLGLIGTAITGKFETVLNAL